MLGVLLVAGVSGISCNMYSCAPTPADWNDGDCIAFVDDVYFLRPCSSSQYSYCQPISSPGNSTCSLQPASTGYNISWPGEPCSDDLSCVYGTCRNATCIGLAQGSNCTTDAACAPGLYCNSTCTPLLGLNGVGCTRDAMCSNSQGCNMKSSSSGVCTDYLSISSGGGVWPCEYYRNNLCSSGICSTSNSDTAFCIDVKTPDNNYPLECSDSSDCQSSVDNKTMAFTYSTCSCAYNALGTSYCGLFPGDKPYASYISWLGKWLKSDEIMNCNTDRRIAPRCQETYWDDSSLLSLNYYKAYVDYFVAIQGNDRCVQAIYTSNYWEISATFEVSETDEYDDAAMWMTLGLSVLTLY
mmetsp:Transcript_9543/g.18579  ORF Transcript_9543/g.18579 Transcript_9543/m.18579 type:complete len:354 (+) Transcript_9543:79-1140(+)